MMLSHWLMRAAARVTLASYLTQLVAPVVWAMEVEGPSDRFGIRSQRGREPSPPREAALQRSFRRSLELGSWERLAAPSPEAQAKAQGILEAPQPTSSGYQYRLRVKTLDTEKEKFLLKLSRKAKDASVSSERLYTTEISKGRLKTATFSDSPETQEDVLLNLFRGGFVHKLTNHGDTVCFAWNVPGVGTLKVARDGAVIIDQDDAAPFLSSYDLIVKTTGKLSITSLAVANLTLKSRETEILMMGAVSADRLSIDQQCKLVNEGGLRAKQIIGQGVLENRGILRLEGTREEPAILDVKQVLNKKSARFPIEPKIEASHLRITSGNKSFYNGKGAELQATETLVIDPFGGSYPSSFTNKGSVHLQEAHINREVINFGFWQAFQMAVEEKAFTNKSLGTLKILDYLTVNSHLLNKGEMDVKNLLRAKTGVNKGTLKGDGLMLGVETSFENEGNLSAKAILGEGSFLNRKTLNLASSEANPAYIGVRSFTNRNPENKCHVAQVKGRNVVVTKTNQEFSNGEKSELLVDHLSFSYDAENPHHFLMPEKDIHPSDRYVDNYGHIKSNKVDINHSDDFYKEVIWQNSGLIEAGTFGINGSEVFFNNNQTGVLKAGYLWTNGDSLHNGGEIQATQGISLNSCHNQGTGKIYGENLVLNIQQSLYNDGQIIVHGLAGTGVFVNRGNVRLTGAAENPSQIAVKRFENLSPNAATRQNPNSLPVKVIGSHIVVAPQNEAFITQPGSEIIAKSLVFTPLANPAGKEAAANNAFDNKGSIGSLENPLEVLVINRQGSVNFGSIRTLSFTAEGWRFQNAKGAKLHVGKSVEARLTVFQNDGEMLVDQGTFTQQAGEFINTGKWDHQGDIELGSTALRNTNGTLIWQKGKWSFAPCEHVNNGEWVLDQIVCSQPLTVQNYATLHLKNGGLTFAKLVNHKNLIFSAGQYTVTDAFANNHLLSFLENDWALTDEASHATPHRLVLTGNAAQGGISLATGDMESGKTLIYDIQSLPKAIRSEENVIFSPRHRQSRTLDDLSRVMARGKVAFYTPAITTTKNYEFGGIGHLDLYVGGLFTTHLTTPHFLRERCKPMFS